MSELLLVNLKGKRHSSGYLARSGEAIPSLGRMSQFHVQNFGGEYEEIARRGELYVAANQADVTSTVGLAATYTGLCLNNPTGSGKVIVPLAVAAQLCQDPAAATVLGVGVSYLAAGVTVHTTPLVIYNTLGKDATLVTVKADAACTLVGTPRLVDVFGSSLSTIASGIGPMGKKLGAAHRVPPGGMIFVYSLTVVHYIAAFLFTVEDEADA